MIKTKYSFILFILFIHYTFSNEIIEINIKSSIEEIKTKYGIVLYDKRNTIESDRSYCNSYYIQMSNLKNLSNVNFPELRKKYEKFKVTFLLEQSDKVKINFIEFDNRICYLILTEILYNAGYINKKICVFDNEENIVYLGGDDFINKNLKKFIFYSNDTFTQLIANSSSYEITHNINFMDFISYFTFDLIINELIFGNKNKNIIVASNKFYEYASEKYNITFKLKNKIIKLGVVNNGNIYSDSFFNNFYFSEYNLEKNEFIFYLSPSKYNDNIVTETNNEMMYKTNNVSIIIYFFIVLSISYAVISRNKKRKNEEYPIDISDVY